MNYYIEIKITFGKNTNDNPNSYTLTKVFKFNCATFYFYKNEIKVHQNHNQYVFDLDEIDELYIKRI